MKKGKGEEENKEGRGGGKKGEDLEEAKKEGGGGQG